MGLANVSQITSNEQIEINSMAIGGTRNDPELHSTVLILTVGPITNFFPEGGPLASGIGVRQRRQACFSTEVDPMIVSPFTRRYDLGEPWKIPHKLKQHHQCNEFHASKLLDKSGHQKRM